MLPKPYKSFRKHKRKCKCRGRVRLPHCETKFTNAKQFANANKFAYCETNGWAGKPAPTVTANMVDLNEFGKIVDAEWKNLTIKYPNVNIGEYIIMPNHFHGIIEITERTVTIGNIIGYFKYKTTKMINLPEKLWQRNYWEHIIRDETEYAKIVEYIRDNPNLWGKKCLNEILPQT
jgi:REP element-mobilizing transposase RayT